MRYGEAQIAISSVGRTKPPRLGPACPAESALNEWIRNAGAWCGGVISPRLQPRMTYWGQLRTSFKACPAMHMERIARKQLSTLFPFGQDAALHPNHGWGTV